MNVVLWAACRGVSGCVKRLWVVSWLVGVAEDGAGDGGRVLRIGLGAAWCQVGDATHRQSGQVAHGDARVLGYRHRPNGGGLVRYHQQVPVIGQLVVGGVQPVLVVGQYFVKGLPPVPAQDRGPVLALTDVRYR